MLDSQATSAAIYKQLFTDAEWDTISAALDEYIASFASLIDETPCKAKFPFHFYVSSLLAKIQFKSL